VRAAEFLSRSFIVRIVISLAPVLAACTLVSSQCAATRAVAQSSSIPQTPATLASWGASTEIVVSGTVDSVVTDHVAGRPGGVNVRVNSTRGSMEANFGPHPSSTLTKLLTPGQTVTLTGAVRADNSNALLVRTANIGGQSYAVRNMKGLPAKPAASGLQATRGHQGSFGGGR
jgi:hypothetical protein